jgi:hypothetical protein
MPESRATRAISQKLPSSSGIADGNVIEVAQVHCQ